MGNPIPEKVVNYNVYDDTEKLVGVSGEVTLPTLEAMSETISGAGILGEFDSINPGHFGSMTIEITFRTLFQKSFSLLRNRGRSLVLRAAQQSYDVSNGQVSHRGLKVTIKYSPKGLELGKLAVGGATESKNTLEVLYLKVEENGKVLLELDKLNFVYKVDGVDELSSINKLI
ncbi:phage major tail tube protein [Neobacillus mesonae]|uniref:phage major tail tube protein n=1 Tax=Neobacillus mesonae TaxID=1193713 RepID=UPI0020412FC4|nr:phage major tail tube protein [Neobacillus mesonae]MCM3567850.1 phage major tail tube protein [Neobacillus mesonae]